MSAWRRPGCPQSSPWLFASVTSVAPAPRNAESALGGAEKTNCFGWGTGQPPPKVSADSKLTMARSACASSAWAPGPSAVVGSAASRLPSTEPAGKLTSPPKTSVAGAAVPVPVGIEPGVGTVTKVRSVGRHVRGDRRAAFEREGEEDPERGDRRRGDDAVPPHAIRGEPCAGRLTARRPAGCGERRSAGLDRSRSVVQDSGAPHGANLPPHRRDRRVPSPGARLQPSRAELGGRPTGSQGGAGPAPAPDGSPHHQGGGRHRPPIRPPFVAPRDRLMRPA